MQKSVGADDGIEFNAPILIDKCNGMCDSRIEASSRQPIESSAYETSLRPDCVAMDENDSCQTMKRLSSAVGVEAVEAGGDDGQISIMVTHDSMLNGIDVSTDVVTYAGVDNDRTIADELRDENERLRQSLVDMKAQHLHLQSMLLQKENLVDLQKKELELCESEKDSLKRDYEMSKKEKEQAVVRYAMLEKCIIDANGAKDLTARKLKDAQRELEMLSNRVKTISAERDKSYKEVRECIRENETLKYDLQSCETKFKWNQVKLKQELNAKAELEKRLNEMRQQFNQLNDQRQNQMDSERKVEREQGAQLIMLKHLVDEKERSLSVLQKSIGDLRTEYTELREKYDLLMNELESQKQQNVELAANLDAKEKALQVQLQSVDELKSQLNEAQMQRQMHGEKTANLSATIDKLKYIEENFHEQSAEMAMLRSKEDEQLRLLKDLTEKCVSVENKLILANSKASGLQLDNERLNKENKLRQRSTQQLEDELEKAKTKHNDEIKLFNRILADEKSHSETLQNQLDNVTGDLEATKNKHTQTVKELNRELIALRAQQQNAAHTDESMDECDGGGSGNQPTNGVRYDTNKEPTKKALIDRIVKLQRQLAKQTEKIEFLENHCIALFNELKAKTS